MRVITATLESSSSYSQSRYHNTDKLAKESAADYNLRTWKNQCTLDSNGMVAIPAMAIKMALDSTAKKLKERVPGKGIKTWIDYFVGGVIPGAQSFSLNILVDSADGSGKQVMQNLPVDSVDCIDIWANADGVRGSGKRVMRRFPLIPKWKADIVLDVVDDSLPTDLVERYLSEAGKLIGIGRFRPEKGGFNGRFTVKSVKWS